MTIPRDGHIATLVDNGQVLMAVVHRYRRR
jgi:hypothetical protein